MKVAHAVVFLFVVVAASACDVIGGAGTWSAPLPAEGTCVAALEEEDHTLVGYQPIDCHPGLIWQVEKVFQGDDRCPSGTEPKLISNVKGALTVLWHVCLKRL